ncbi:hypothetical protein UFOVP116_213 [uncultured Caudovirales phage]|uniref:Uncharacterized protein n=1 Tax=uncultured Caudovirales phage TaxID=2100421 RepID=A0A6J5LA83_9CAUD|nr:hypothetical protein UFOVP116_213 [uncultured Caudovirales phage]
MPSNTTLKGYSKIPTDYTGDIWIEGQIVTLEAELLRLRQALKPQPKREWASLTEEEISAIGKRMFSFTYDACTDGAFARAIEAKLKEKNT